MNITYRLLLSLMLFSLFASTTALAQSQETERQIVPEEFVKARTAKSTTAATGAKRPTYQPAGAAGAKSKIAKNKQGELAQLGLTVWRLRAATAVDSGARIIVQHEGETDEWVPERITANTPLRSGTRIRFSFEAPQSGYLYVVDRERYADGSLGEPILIFPTTRTRGGDNKVAPGVLIEIPGQDDRPNYFTMRATRADHVGETLTVLVTPQPLPELTIGAKALKLSVEQVAQWEKQFGAQTEHFEMVGGAGRTWTKAEQEAGANATRQLTQDEPGPQTIYRVAAKPGAPLLVNIGLRYSRASTTTRPTAR
jgi:hypothetical protein